MLKLAKRYNKYFDINNADGIIKKIFFAFMLTIPHLITCLALILFFPEKWAGVILVGLILPDLYYFIYMLRIRIFPPDKGYAYGMIHLSIKTTSHILVLALVIFLFFQQEYVIALSGGLHVLIDMMGF